jgi:hypothetical protein
MTDGEPVELQAHRWGDRSGTRGTWSCVAAIPACI